MRNKKWRGNHPDQFRGYVKVNNKIYRKRHPDKIKNISKKYYEKNKEKINEKQRNRLKAKSVKESTKICPMCGKEFITESKRRKYCDSCVHLRHNAQARSYMKEKYTQLIKRALGSTNYCKECGKPYVVEHHKQKYCLECQAKRIGK